MDETNAGAGRTVRDVEGPTLVDGFGWSLIALAVVGMLAVFQADTPIRPPSPPRVGTYAVLLALGSFGAAILALTRTATGEDRRRLREWDRLPDALILLSPCVFGAVTFAVMLAAVVAADAHRNPAVGDPLLHLLLWVHSTAACLASGAAGLLTRGSAAVRIAVAIGGAVIGFSGHALLFLVGGQAAHLIRR